MQRTYYITYWLVTTATSTTTSTTKLLLPLVFSLSCDEVLLRTSFLQWHLSLSVFVFPATSCFKLGQFQKDELWDGYSSLFCRIDALWVGKCSKLCVRYTTYDFGHFLSPFYAKLGMIRWITMQLQYKSCKWILKFSVKGSISSSTQEAEKIYRSARSFVKWNSNDKGRHCLESWQFFCVVD